MRRRGYMFTGRSHSDNGKFSTALGAISFVSTCLVIYLSYKSKGALSPKLGAATLFAFLIAIGGEVLGVMSRMEKDKFYLFPNIGIALNSVTLLIILNILYIGLYEI